MALSLPILLSLFVAGVVTGGLGALLGVGGGVLLIPILVLAVGLPMHFAVATSLVTVVATSCAAGSTNVERGTANMRLGMTLEIGTTLGALCGGIAAGLFLPAQLELLFAVVLLPTAFMMWHGGEAAAVDRANTLTSEGQLGALGGEYRDDAAGRTIRYRVRRLWAGWTISFLAGNLSGLLGIGGGVFKVPGLNLLCDVPMKAAAATSNFMIGVTAAAGAFLYLGRGEVHPVVTAAVVLGVLPGSVVGLWLGERLRGKTLRRVFAVLLALVAVQMFLRPLLRGA